MRRLFGMMPSAEIKIEKTYKDSNGLKVRIQAGENGWTIVWADGGTSYKDEVHTAEENFNIALDQATKEIGELTECEVSECLNCSEE